MKKFRYLICILIVLSTLLALFSSCSDCEHEWDNGYVAMEPTEKAAGYRIYTCTKCGETKGEEIKKLVHSKHDYSKVQWGNDESNHWLICDTPDCDVTTGKGIHMYHSSASEGYVCQICKHISTSHSFTNSLDFDNKFHWTKCDHENCPSIAYKTLHVIGEDSKCINCDFTSIVTE